MLTLGDHSQVVTPGWRCSTVSDPQEAACPHENTRYLCGWYRTSPRWPPYYGNPSGSKSRTTTEALNTSSALTNCDPEEFNSDGAVVLRDGTENVMAVMVERQNGHDSNKRRSWPAYLVTLHVRLKCPAVLLVLCPSDAMARWCAVPIRTGHPGFDLVPLTIGPSRMPKIADEQQARLLPELSVLSARAHGNNDPGTLKRGNGGAELHGRDEPNVLL